ncbi:MAG: hypothetical protein ACYTGB_16720, partial [Planctomycetota bacterium]
ARALTDEECTVAYNVMVGEFRGVRLWTADCAHGEWRDTGFSGEKLRKISGLEAGESVGSRSSVAVVPCDWEGRTVTAIPRTALDQALSGIDEDALDGVGDGFNLAYAVRCAEKGRARALFAPGLVELLLRKPRWTLELVEGAAVLHDGRVWEPAEVPEALEFAAELAAHLPPRSD